MFTRIEKERYPHLGKPTGQNDNAFFFCLISPKGAEDPFCVNGSAEQTEEVYFWKTSPQCRSCDGCKVALALGKASVESPPLLFRAKI